MKVVIVGGVAGGASLAARLRRLDENAQIIMFERGSYISFANCGLPYYIGGIITDRDELLLQTPESFNARFDVDVRINSEVVSIDRAAKTVQVKGIANLLLSSIDARRRSNSRSSSVSRSESAPSSSPPRTKETSSAVSLSPMPSR